MVVAVPDDHRVAKAALHTCEFDDAITYRLGGCAGWRGIVHTKVGFHGLEDGVQAHRETAGLARESHWRCQVSTAQAFAIHAVVVAFLAGFLVPDSFVSLVAVVEVGRQDAAGADRLTVGFQNFINHRKAGTLAQAAVKVDLVGENLGQLTDDGIRQAGFIGSVIERTRHCTASHPDAGRHWRGFQSRFQALLSPLDHQALEKCVGFVVEPADIDLA